MAACPIIVQAGAGPDNRPAPGGSALCLAVEELLVAVHVGLGNGDQIGRNGRRHRLAVDGVDHLVHAVLADRARLLRDQCLELARCADPSPHWGSRRIRPTGSGRPCVRSRGPWRRPGRCFRFVAKMPTRSGVDAIAAVTFWAATAGSLLVNSVVSSLRFGYLAVISAAKPCAR